MGVILAAKVFTIARAPLTRGIGRGPVKGLRKKLLQREAKQFIATKIILGTVGIILDPYNQFFVPHSGGRLISSEEAALNVLNPSRLGIPQAFHGQVPERSQVKAAVQTFVAFTLDPLDFYWELGTHSPREIKAKLADDVIKKSTEIFEVDLTEVKNGQIPGSAITRKRVAG